MITNFQEGLTVQVSSLEGKINHINSHNVVLIKKEIENDLTKYKESCIIQNKEQNDFINHKLQYFEELINNFLKETIENFNHYQKNIGEEERDCLNQNRKLKENKRNDQSNGPKSEDYITFQNSGHNMDINSSHNSNNGEKNTNIGQVSYQSIKGVENKNALPE